MDSAYLTLFAFFATDEFDGERRELLESGVSVRRIQVLYPLDFSSVADTLRAYLARNGRVHTFKKDDAGAFESADEALWNSLDGNEKNRVLAEISVILNDEEIKHDLRVSHNTTSRRGDDTLVSQVNNDYHSLRYAMGYLMYGSSIREAAGKHLLNLASAFLPDLRVATLATEQELDASACWSLLATAISPDFAAREELLASKVPAHTVDSLYPLDFAHFIDANLGLLRLHGAEHLASITNGQWFRMTFLASNLRERLEELDHDNDDNYEQQWRSWDGAEFGEFVYRLLNKSQEEARANNRTFWLQRALYCAYWLIIEPRLLEAVNHDDADELAQWLVKYFLA